MSDVPVAQKKLRRWWVGLLVLLIAVGGGIGWRSRLTPEERVLVGSWSHLAPSVNGGPIVESVYYFQRNRNVSKGGESWYWSARNGQFTVREPLLQRLYSKWMAKSSMTIWNDETTHGRIQVIDQDTVDITWFNSKTDEKVFTFELKRIVK